MNFKNVIIGVIAALSVLYFLSRHSDIENSAPKPEQMAPEISLTNGSPAVGQSPKTQSIQPYKTEVQKCFPNLKSDLTLEDVLKSNPEIDFSKLTLDLEKENSHIKNPDGSETRLHIGPSEGHSKFPYDVKKFSVGKDNLPTPEKLPKEFKDMDPLQIYQKYTSSAHVIFRQSTMTFHSQDSKISGRLVTENGVVKTLKIFGSDKSLNCEENKSLGQTDCRCEIKH